MKKSRVASAVLAFFFGAFGVHKFYLRRPGEGFLYIFITMMSFRVLGMPISQLLGFFDAIRFLTMSDEEFDKKYNSNQGVQSRTRRRPRNVQRTSRNQQRRPRFESEYRKTTRKKRYPKSNPFKQSGIRKFKDFDINGAIEDFTKALKINPEDPALHFNLACSYSLNEEADKSFYHLQKAIENGFNDFEKIATHQALAFLRVQDKYESFKDNGYKFEGQMKTQIEASQQNENLLDEDVLLKQLNKLDELRSKGLLTQKEFLEQKRRLMS